MFNNEKTKVKLNFTMDVTYILDFSKEEMEAFEKLRKRKMHQRLVDEMAENIKNSLLKEGKELGVGVKAKVKGAKAKPVK